jgi:hypothetical protein
VRQKIKVKVDVHACSLISARVAANW